MNKKSKDPRYQLHGISRSFVEDLLKTPDDEILAEAATQNNCGKNLGESAKAAYQNALKVTGQKRLQAARDAMQRKSESVGLEIDVHRARKLLLKIVAANDPEFNLKITLAARDLQDLNDSEVLEIISDLQRLGAFPEDGPS